MILTAMFAAFWDPMPVLADAYCVSAAKDQSLDFGRMRLFGSLAFICANLLSGIVIERLGASFVIWLAVMCLSLPLIIIPFLPSDRQFQGARRAAAGEWRTLLKDKSLLLMILSVSVLIASHALLNQYSTALQYGGNRPGLKQHIANLMKERGVECEPDNIEVTSGGQQCMDLLCRIFLNHGETFTFEHR